METARVSIIKDSGIFFGPRFQFLLVTETFFSCPRCNLAILLNGARRGLVNAKANSAEDWVRLIPG